MPLVQTRGAASAQGFGEFAQASAVPNYIEEVFSTYLYTGNTTAQTITNGIDLAGKGGFVWIKSRTSTAGHSLWDTSRTPYYYLVSNATSAEQSVSSSNALTAYNSNGFTLTGGSNAWNGSQDYVSWTFREQPKFFDVVTYTGTGNSGPQTINHNLGSVPGAIICKSTTSVVDWGVYHRSLGATKGLYLNLTQAEQVNNTLWNDTAPTSTTFTVGASGGSSSSTNAVGQTYVAYLFAHDAGGFGLTGTDNVISCGSFTYDSTNGNSINLGYEAQFVIVKSATAVTQWYMQDIMRGMASGPDSGARLFPNLSSAEDTGFIVGPTATGFNIKPGFFSNGNNIIYIAIRRGPMKVPTVGTSVFYPEAIAQSGTIDSTGVPFPPDLVNTFSRDGTDRVSQYDQFQFVDRLRGLGTPSNTLSTDGLSLLSASTAAEASATSYVQLKADSQNITRGAGWGFATYGNWINYFFRRAPSFFDEVCYTGTGATLNLTHNLGAVPEMMIVKGRNSGFARNWAVYHSALGNTKYLYLNNTSAPVVSSTAWNNTTPTSSVFTVDTLAAVNYDATETYVAYLFSTCIGVSKCGSYTGNGSTQTIDCGFGAGGARFVLIRRTDTTGDWYVYDTARGMTVLTDPYLLLNSTAAETATLGSVTTVSTGFALNSSILAAINISAGSYIFLAIS